MPTSHVATKDRIVEKKASVPEHTLSLSYARPLSWFSLIIILFTSLGLSFFISHSAQETLLTKQKEFARLMVNNLNNQIFRRFALPTILARGRIALRQPTQYEHLDRVVQSVIEGLPVAKLRIYDFSYLVAYSTSVEDLGRAGLAHPRIEAILHGAEPISEIIASFPSWQAPFRLPLKPGTFLLRVLAPLRGEPLPGRDDVPIMGAIELTQDITEDYERVLAFQGIIVVMCLLSSVILFALMLVLIHRSERILHERMQKNRLLENELHSNERLASMGRVVASIAHEIRNPLGIIRSSAELLQRRANGQDKGTIRLLKAIYDETLRLSQTVNDFLDYARPKKPRQTILDINTVLDQVLGFLEGALKAQGIVVHRETAPNLLTVGDADLLYRAFYNIVVNAQQAIEGSGSITITSIEAQQGMLCICCMDSGPGFAEDALAHIMDPFYTTKDGGTGLGLPIVKSIIESHEGRIVCENGEQGACIRVFLRSAVDAKEIPEQAFAKI
ncbi:MAG: two-component sensor histidine kinase [Desulfovibrio sp.]|nr:two-component sensor histidine kinase [Desulfovibrio sp.]